MLSFETRSRERFNFYAYERPFMHCLYFVSERKCYARSYVEFTRHWKSTLTEIAPKSMFFCVNRNPTRCGFRADSKAIRYSLNKALTYLLIKTTLLYECSCEERREAFVNFLETTSPRFKESRTTVSEIFQDLENRKIS